MLDHDVSSGVSVHRQPEEPFIALRGSVRGSLPGVAPPSERFVVLRDPTDPANRPLAHARVGPDGTFEMSRLPDTVRGKALVIDVLTSRESSPAVDASTSLTFPVSGDAVVVVGGGELDSTVGPLTASPTLLAPQQLAALLDDQHEATTAFAKVRAHQRTQEAQRSTDWVAATEYLESLRRPASSAGLTISARDLDSFDPETIFKRPSRGLARNPAARVARLKLSSSEESDLKGAIPTLCRVMGARRNLRGLERRPRLINRLQQDARISALELSPTPPVVPPGPSAPPPGTESVTDLEEAAEKAALRKLEAAIDDLFPGPSAQPSTASDLKRLRALASELELAGGPANVTAAREVQTLQVAFEHAVTRVFDKGLIATLARFAELRDRLEAEHSIVLPTPPPQAPMKQALSAYLTEMRQVLHLNSSERVPQVVRLKFPSITERAWAGVSDVGRDVILQRVAARTTPADHLGNGTRPILRSSIGFSPTVYEVVADLRDLLSREPTSEIDALLESSPSILGEADRTLNDLIDRLSDPYEFTVFVPGTVNYGLLLTYRQEWSPIRYQVGRLVDTIPLSPGERREFKITTTRKIHENRKTVTTQTREAQREATSTRRLESEAIEAATMAINNQLSTNGSFDIGVGSVGGATQFAQNLTEESRRTLKSFSEMAQKAVDSLKEQVEVTLESTAESTVDASDVRTITNNNGEFTVTHLLYELERRYHVETHLQRVRPVILVALPVPSPDEITAAWILEYSWAIREALLDQTLREALDGLEEAQSGAAVEYEVRRAAMLEQRRVANQLVTEYESLEAAAQARRRAIVSLLQGEGLAEAGEMSTGQRIALGVVTGGISELFGGGQTSEDEELEAKRKATEKALEYLEAQIEAKGAAMTTAAAALRSAIDKFTEAAADRRRTTLATARLQVHIRDNIFHYMHAIWATTHPDHRYFTLYDDEVPFHTPNAADYVIQPAANPTAIGTLPGIDDGGADLELTIAAPDMSTAPGRRRLADVADIDRPLGFRGNFAIFELLECSQLTDHMAAEYFDPITGVANPGSLSGVSSHELIEYAQAAISLGLLSQAQLTLIKDLARRLDREQLDASDELTLPTGQVFMEAVKGDTTLLEPFKLVHRGLDVLAAEEAVRVLRLDALRRARKVAQSELERDPTTVDHLYLGETPHVATPNP